MKKFKKLTALILTVIMLFSVFTVTQITVNAVTSGDYSYFVLNDGTAKITNYSGNATELSIPSQIDGYKVTGIGNAFWYRNSLTMVTIPYSVTNITYTAFDHCDSLTTIIVDDNNPKYDSRNNCNAIIETETNTLISGCGNTVIPDSVTSIENCAFFWRGNLTTITIPASVTSLGNGVFSGCDNLTTIIVDDNNPKYDSRNNCNAIIETETNTLIYGCSNTVIPDSVTSIRSQAFEDCTSLITITIPDSVTSIGDWAFGFCFSLTAVKLPNSITRIENSTFVHCSNLKSIKIPDSVTSIGSSAFFFCSDLTTVTIPDSVTSIEDDAFACCSGLSSIWIPRSVTDIGESVFDYCDNLTAYVYENSYAHEYVVRNQINYELIKSKPNIVLGDVNFDGRINVIDATSVQKYSVGNLNFNYYEYLSADVNKDDIVNVIDSTLIQEYSAGLISNL